MKQYEFKSDFSIVDKIDTVWTQDQIKNEPMLFNCDLLTAFCQGGPITRSVIGRLPASYDDHDLVIDSRVHMLMPGWYPCIPGWHHDSVPRTRLDGQPNYDDRDAYSRIKHLAVVFNAEICPTQFMRACVNLNDIEPGEKYYKKWHPILDNIAITHHQTTHNVLSGEMIEFDADTFHQGTAAVANGWRYFIRISKNDHTRKATNELRKQVQVYMPVPMEGW